MKYRVENTDGKGLVYQTDNLADAVSMAKNLDHPLIIREADGAVMLDADLWAMFEEDEEPPVQKAA
jgi:hypothetical protein